MRKIVRMMALLIALPASLPPVIVSEKSAASGAFGGFDELDESNPLIAVLGDTQVTTPWEFWNERNDVQTGVILAELADRLVLRSVHLVGRNSCRFRVADEFAIPVDAAAASLTRPRRPACPAEPAAAFQ